MSFNLFFTFMWLPCSNCSPILAAGGGRMLPSTQCHPRGRGQAAPLMPRPQQLPQVCARTQEGAQPRHKVSHDTLSR